jgi:plastocyanin
MRRLLTLAITVAAATLAITAAAPLVAGAQSGEAKAAKIVDFSFEPNSLTVKVGDTVTWTNTGQRPHTVTDRGGTFDTDPIAPNDTGKVTFSAPGRYDYFCRINPSKMNGVIVVEAGDQAVKATRVEAFDPAREGAKLSFVPPNLSVEAGSAIVFANVGGKPHTLTADDGSFDTGVVKPGAEQGRFAGDNATLTLKEPGKFPFHCEIHPAAMKGVLTVTGEAAGAQAPTAASAAPRQVSVAMQDFAFDEPEVSVAPGGTVTWENRGGAPHTATFDDVKLDTGNVAPNTNGKLTAPDKPGSYSYKCSIHPAKMRGVLVVVGEDTEDPTAKAVAVAGRAPPPAAAAEGPGGGLSALVLTTGVLGAFLAGFGISAFARNRPSG